MPRSSRGARSAAYLTALGFLAVWCSARPMRIVRAADPPRDAPGVTVYDPNPQHLWNRLHGALCERPEGEGPKEPGQLDPFRWDRNPYRDQREARERAGALLDEFDAQRGEKLCNDPRKRALLQRDLWAFFDTVAPSRALVAPGEIDGEIELARRAAKLLPRLALAPGQIEGLPDNFAEAVAAGKFPDWSEAGRLWDLDGPWVLLGSEEPRPLARTHVEIFGGRSAFFVFLRLPEGREQAREYLAELRDHGADAKLPEGARFALVRRMLLIDDQGGIALTPVVETMQIRGPEAREFKLNREDFMAGKPGLNALGPEDRERTFLIFLGRNAGNGREKVLRSCTSCHRPDKLESHARTFPPFESIRPNLRMSDRDEEFLRARRWKGVRYEWGLLQGLTLVPPKG